MAPKQSSATVRHSFAFGVATVRLGKTDHSVEVAIDDLPEHVRVYLMNYGLKQCLNDAAAGGKDEGEKIALFDKRLDNLRAGALRAQREGLSPLARHARDIATEYAKRKGLKDDALKAWVAKAVASDVIRDMAQKRLEAEAAMPEIGLD